MSYKFIKIMENNSSPLIRKVRIILLVLIIAGLTLIFTQNIWLPKLTDYVLTKQY